MKIGSLFDGSGGFPLAGVIRGGIPVWRSEVEPYPIAVTRSRFPNMVHLGDVQKVNGAEVEPVDVMTFGSPCQDLSVAGKGKGMTKGSGTRSGLLWEVERLLNEVENLPQVLLMENVPQVHGKKNVDDFRKWIEFLESKGYSNHWQDLNAKHYGVAQNRNRCFMVSILGNYKYEFPNTIELNKTMKDYLEDEVDEKYYINNEKAQKLIEKLICDGTLPSRAEQSRLALTLQSMSLEKLVSQTASVQGRTEESLTEVQKVPVLCNYSIVEKVTNVARTICSRDYKGFGTSSQTQNGVIEWK
jgi:DNA-cytosine methyltransferase